MKLNEYDMIFVHFFEISEVQSLTVMCFVYAGNHVFNPKGDTDAQNKILALLLHKSLLQVEKDDPLGKK